MDLSQQTANKIVTQKSGLTVICGANVETLDLEEAQFTSLSMLRNNMREVLNIGDNFKALINGKEVGDVDEGKIFLEGNEQVEFKKPSGQKG